MAVQPDDLRSMFKGSGVDEFLIESEWSSIIDDAELVVSEDLSGKGLSDDRLELITKYVAAHMVVLSAEQGGIRRSRVGQADDSYVVPDSLRQGWASTRFGQQAMALDTSNTLSSQAANVGKLPAEFRVV